MTTTPLTIAEVEVEAEPAGRRLDAWVHEHVLGRPVKWNSRGHAWDYECGILGLNPVPAYSSDIAAAWPLLDLFSYPILSQYDTDGSEATSYWRCTMQPKGGGPAKDAEGKTATEAICKAALLLKLREGRPCSSTRTK